MNKVSIAIGIWLLHILCLSSTANATATATVIHGIKLLNDLQYYKAKTTEISNFDPSAYSPEMRRVLHWMKVDGKIHDDTSVEIYEYVNGKPVYEKSTIGKIVKETTITDQGLLERKNGGSWHRLQIKGHFPLPIAVNGSPGRFGNGFPDDSPREFVASLVRSDKINGVAMKVYKSFGGKGDMYHVQVFWIGVLDGIIHREETRYNHETLVNDFYDFNVPIHHTTHLEASL